MPPTSSLEHVQATGISLNMYRRKQTSAFEQLFTSSVGDFPFILTKPTSKNTKEKTKHREHGGDPATDDRFHAVSWKQILKSSLLPTLPVLRVQSTLLASPRVFSVSSHGFRWHLSLFSNCLSSALGTKALCFFLKQSLTLYNAGCPGTCY